MNEINEHPQWYLSSYENYVEPFVKLDQQERGELVSQASAIFMTTLISLPETLFSPVAAVGSSYHQLAATDLNGKFNNLPIEDFDTKFKDFSREDLLAKFKELFKENVLLLILLGASVESMGMLQMKISDVRTN